MRDRKLIARSGICLRRYLTRTLIIFVLCSIQGYAQSPEQARSTYLVLPQSFEPNLGQAGRGVDFISHGLGYTFLLSASGADLQLIATQLSTPDQKQERAVRIKLRGANSRAQAEGREVQAGRSYYFIGNSCRAWRTDIPHYGRVEYREV